MNTIRIYLTESGRIADLQKDFPLYQGQFQNKLLNVFVPTSILAPMFTSSGAVSADYVASTSTKIGMTYTARDGSIKTSKNYYMRYLKTLMYKGVEYALYERKLPKEFTFYAGQGENSPVLIINVVNIEQQSGDTPPLVLSVITSQTCHLDVMQSTFLDRDELNEPSELENLNAQVQALNALMPKKQDKEDESIALEQAPTEKTVVGAINELGGLVKTAQSSADTAQQTAETAQTTADNATTLANNAVATANGAVATANEAKTTAQTAETNANSAVDKADNAIDRANKAYEKAANNVYAVGFMTLQEAITAVNGYDNTVLKTNDNILVVAQGSPDLYVTSVEATNVPYNFTTVDKFNDDLVKNTVLQIGYYKVAFYETDGQPVTVAYQNVVVKSTDWVASTEFADFPYEAKIPLSNFVDYKTVPQVVFDIADTMSGNYAPICKSGDKCVYIYSKVQNEITLKTVITFAPNVNGASVVGGGYNNRGKWVASTTYAIDDLVYTDNGQYVCIEGITSTTSPEQDTTHWQATFVATGKTKNTLTISGQDNGTGVQKTFDGSTAVEVSFDETTMTTKEVNGVLKVGAKGTIPEALPQEASALKNGNLPTSGWGVSASLWTGSEVMPYDNPKRIGNIGKTWATSQEQLADVPDGWQATIDGKLYTDKTAKLYRAGSSLGIEFTPVGYNVVIIYTNGDIYIWNTLTAGERITQIGCSRLAKQTYTISDTSITANSDILMELTDDGGVKAYSMEAGSITVIRDTVPTQPIPYTYKVKQTNASGQFTLVNHFVPNVPESPTSLPVTYKKASGSLPTSGWDTNTPFFEGELNLSYGDNSEIKICDGNYRDTKVDLTVTAKATTNYEAGENISTVTKTKNSGSASELVTFSFSSSRSNDAQFMFKEDGIYVKLFNSPYTSYGCRLTLLKAQAPQVGGIPCYTISDTDITANTSVKMYLTDEGGVKAQSKANGSITVIRDTVPTTAIPYEYEVEETSAEGLFEVINAYVPTKTSQLTNDSGFAKTTEANTWTGVQTFSNADGIKTDRVHNLDNNDAWYNFDGSNNRFGSPSRPTIIRTSEARPRAQVPSGETTVTKEIALLEDIPSAGEWVTVTENSATLTEAGTYQVLFGENYGVQSIIYWDGSTGANGIPSTTASVTNGTAIIAERYLTVAANGVLSTHITMITVKDGSWTQTTPSFSGFKYRKIN